MFAARAMDFERLIKHECFLRYLSHRLQVDLENHLPAFFADVKKETAQAKEIGTYL